MVYTSMAWLSPARHQGKKILAIRYNHAGMIIILSMSRSH
jgi:hypothetical protein